MLGVRDAPQGIGDGATKFGFGARWDRNQALTFEKMFSIGLRSGEYGGR